MGLSLSACRIGAALAWLLVARSASADPEPSAAELASARSLFTEARAAEEHGDWSEALTKLDAVAKVKMTPQVRFHLGLCQEHTSRLLEALNNLERAASEGVEHKLPTVAQEAAEHAASVRARLPKLLIALPAGADARVEVDGQVVASVLLSRAIAFDPGVHKIVATAPGLAFARDVSLAEREEKRVEVVFTRAPASYPSLALAAPVTPPVPAVDAPAPAGTDGASDDASRARLSTWGWVAVGVLGASASFFVRQGAIDDIEEACPTHQNCPRRLEAAQGTARTFGTLGAILGVFGGASVATGVVLLVRPRAEPSQAKIGLMPWMTANGAGASGAVSW
jgi:hypothetical protein